jgi:uncharacterized protein YceH (UPF0502 family)
MYTFDSRNEVEELLKNLMEKEPPLVVKLPRQVGRKEQRFMHLLSGKPEIREDEQRVREEAATLRVRDENEKIARLEEELAALRREFDILKNDFIILKSQLE